jgi:hypothetical protein
MVFSFPRLLCVAFGLSFLSGAAEAQNATFAPQPYPAVRYERKIGLIPPQRVEIVRIDLKDPDVEVRVAPGGADPDGAGAYQTTLQTLTTIAERERFEVAVNGDFFAVKPNADASGAPSGYVADKWATAVGPAATDGVVWAPASRGARPVLLLDALKRPRIEVIENVPDEARQVVAGSHILIQARKLAVSDEAGLIRTRHPRTAVGIADGGATLVLVVVDGRRAGEATGLSLTELGQIMLDMGCHDALNLDGGGSSELVMREPKNGQLQVVNRPSDNRERAVANVLGVSIRGSLRAPLTTTGTIPPTAAPPVH